jgi:hypothetical protein
MARETILITLLTAFIIVYNGCITGFQDFSGTYHDPILSSPWLPPLTLPAQVFTLTSPSLSFLLGTSEWFSDLVCIVLLKIVRCLTSFPNGHNIQLIEPTLPTSDGMKPGRTGE